MVSQTQAGAAEGSHPDHATGRYLVVARRYRPKTFEQLLGQQHVAQTLGNAINANRVGHAYLFTGARGVGKTSAARIFAKALNCVRGPTTEPDNTCDICQSIDAGEDVDVLEIDGASNRGIDEIRQLRATVNVRPSRARYKIYIIDEVHMLTTQAFNALLKTLEEPPEHVKFIFCTTDPEKIPITVLSRCQRYDFSPISTETIIGRLQQILDQEGREIEPAALALLARRAAGSMRDSQSLLEQLLAFCGDHITLDEVNSVLGVADTGTLDAVIEQLACRNAAETLLAVDEAIRRGVEPGHLVEQILTCVRDMLVASVGGSAELALQYDPAQWPQRLELAQRLGGVESLLAIAQILDQTLVRMRTSTHARVLLELAMIRICALERLDELADVIRQLRSGGGVAIPSAPRAASTSTPVRGASPAPHLPPVEKSSAEKEKKKAVANGEADSAETTLVAQRRVDHGVPQASGVALTPENAAEIWHRSLALLEDMTADFAADAHEVAISAPNRLAVTFLETYNLQKEACERPDRRAKIEQAVRQVVGQPVQIEFRLAAASPAAAPARPPVRSTRQMLREKERHELVVQAVELFDAEIVRVEAERPPAPRNA